MDLRGGKILSCHWSVAPPEFQSTYQSEAIPTKSFRASLPKYLNFRHLPKAWEIVKLTLYIGGRE